MNWNINNTLFRSYGDLIIKPELPVGFSLTVPDIYILYCNKNIGLFCQKVLSDWILIFQIEQCKTVAISKQLGNIRSIEHKVGPVNTDKRLII